MRETLIKEVYRFRNGKNNKETFILRAIIGWDEQEPDVGNCVRNGMTKNCSLPFVFRSSYLAATISCWYEPIEWGENVRIGIHTQWH